MSDKKIIDKRIVWDKTFYPTIVSIYETLNDIKS